MHAIRTAVIGLAAAAVGAGLLAVPAHADWHHGWHRGWHHGWWHGHWGWLPPAVIVAPRPYYYAAPRIYYPPPPVVYAPPSYYAPGISFGVNIR